MYKTLIVSNMNIARSPSFISKIEGCIQAWSACKNANGIIVLRTQAACRPFGAPTLKEEPIVLRTQAACRPFGAPTLKEEPIVLELKGIPASQQLTYVNKQLIVPGAEDQGPLPFSYVLPPEEYELGLCGIDKGWRSLIAGWQKIGYRVRVFSDASIVKPETREMLAKQKRTFCSYKTIYR